MCKQGDPPKSKRFKSINKLDHIQTNINSYGKHLSLPSNDIKYKTLDISPNIDSRISYNQKYFSSSNKIIKSIQYDKYETDGYKTRQIELLLNDSQSTIIDKWFDMHILMHNHTNKLIKQTIFNGEQIPNIATLKKLLKGAKEDIYKQSTISIMINDKKKDIQIPSHLLDYAINDTLNMYKSSMTNRRNKNIKYFRIRYMKTNKPNKIIKIEPIAFTNDTFYKNFLGIVRTNVEDFKFKEHITTTAIITKRKNKYYLSYKIKADDIDTDKKDIISLDPGFRTLLTGYSNNHVLEIGTGINEMMKMKLDIIDKINNFDTEKERKLKDLRNKIKKNKGTEKKKLIEKSKKLENHQLTENRKRKIINKKYEKIKNIVNDIHKKVANYLTSKFGSVIIGNLSRIKFCRRKT